MRGKSPDAWTHGKRLARQSEAPARIMSRWLQMAREAASEPWGQETKGTEGDKGGFRHLLSLMSPVTCPQNRETTPRPWRWRRCVPGIGGPVR
jgi:hypothetical protein